MRKFLQSLLPLCIIPAVMVGSASSPQHTTTGKTSPSKRIFIPQERVIIERPIPPKVEPASYRAWLNVAGQNMLFQTVNFGITLYRPYASLNI